MATQFQPGSTVYIRKYKQPEVLRGRVVEQKNYADLNACTVRLDTGLVLGCVVLNASNQIQLAKRYAAQLDR